MPRFTGQNKKKRNPRYFLNEEVDKVASEAIVNKKEPKEPSDLEMIQQISLELKSMLKDLSPRELELARFKMKNVLKTLSEEDAQNDNVVNNMMEAITLAIDELLLESKENNVVSQARTRIEEAEEAEEEEEEEEG